MYATIIKFVNFIAKVINSVLFIITPDRLLLNSWTISIGPYISHSNFGDDINYYIFKRLAGTKPLNVLNLFPCIANKFINYMCIGSIIDMLTTNKSVIWGSGVLNPKIRIPQKPQNIYAVRGPKTQKYLANNGVKCKEIYGDPALLMPLFYPPKRRSIIYELGIIPHYSDMNNEFIKGLKPHKNVLVINLKHYKKIEHVIDLICSCNYIVSSSLHGLIIADAYGVPNHRITFKATDQIEDFKYSDYFLSVGRKDDKPLFISTKTTINDLYSFKQLYQKISFCPYQLLQVCPFNKRFNIEPYKGTTIPLD